MSSNEEYLENLLQSMMEGKVAGPSKKDNGDSGRQKSAIEMLTGEEPEQALFIEEPGAESGLEMDEGGMPAVSMDADMRMGDSSMAGMDLDDAGADALGMGTAGLAEEAFDGISAGDMALEEPALDDLSIEEPALDDIGLNDSDVELGDITLDGEMEDFGLGAGGMDDIALEEHGLGEMEELVLDDMSLDDSDMELGDIALDDMGLAEDGMEDIGLDAVNADGMEDIGLDAVDMDGIALEEHGLDDMTLMESSLDDMGLEDADMEDLGMGDIGMDNIALEEHSLDDIGLGDADLDGMGLDDSPMEEFSLDDMSGETEVDDMTLEESDFSEMSDDFALEESGMDDLAEINNLLEQSGQDGEIDDEMLALLESVSDSGEGNMTDGENNEFSFFSGDDDGDDAMSSIEGLNIEEETPPEEEKKKKGRKWKKKNKKAAESAAEMTDNQAETGDIEKEEGTDGEKTEKKPGAFARFLAFLTESDEEDEENAEGAMPAGEASDENSELLAELSAEDKKKGKKEKKKKEKKEKGKKGKKAEDGEEGGTEEGAVKKKKKPKKEKKVKEVDEEALKADTGKKLSRKKTIPVFLLCATILLCIIVFTIIIPDHMQKRDARMAYDMGSYEDVYELLYGKDLNEEEDILLHKSTIIMKMERKLKSYQNNLKLGGHELEALNALVQGVALYYELLPEADEYSVMPELEEKYRQILAVLSDQYGLSEANVMDIIYSEDDTVYTQKIMSVLHGVSYAGEEEQLGGVSDVLPEEQEILDGLPEETDNITTDIENDVTDGSSEAPLDDASGKMTDAASAGGTEGTETQEGEIKYIEPVSVEVHQNN